MSEAGAVTFGQVISPTDRELPATHFVDVTEWMRAAAVQGRAVRDQAVLDQAVRDQALPSRA